MARTSSILVGLALICGQTGCSKVVRDKPVLVPGQVKEVVVRVDHGNLEIAASAETTQVEIVRAARDAAAGQGSTHDVKDGVLTVEGRCGGLPKCRINHRLRVGIDTKVTVEIKEGDVALMDVGGDISVEVGLGNVSGLRLGAANTTVHTEGGNIDLIYAAKPQALTANAAAGDVDLRVPAGDYRCDIDDKAKPEFGVKCVANETRTIAASTAVGRLSLRATD